MNDPSPLPVSATSSRALYHQVASLLIYQGVFDHPIGAEFLTLLRYLHHNDTSQLTEATACLQAYGSWFRRLAAAGLSWQDFLLQRLLWDDNPFSQWVQRCNLETVPPSLREATIHDLNLLQMVYGCPTEQIVQWVMIASQTHVGLTPWQMSNEIQLPIPPDRSWGEHLDYFVQHYQRKGTGVFGQYRAFGWQQEQLHPISHPDPIQLDDLVGYDAPQQALCQNTECLLKGLPALNVLLYGSRGSGKSSLVKALLNQYGDRGLRLIEVSLDNLTSLPTLVELLRDKPQKFIIFVDDLSFEEDDERFKNLKVILEGNVVARPDNMVIYATSNRRHLIREFFGDR
ncbi:MAG: hypothetical protein RLZZ490_1697, partial [Cyanobacteriota bacterium]